MSAIIFVDGYASPSAHMAALEADPRVTIHSSYLDAEGK